MKRDAVLSVRDLSVEFPSRSGVLQALTDVSFDIAQGEVLGIVGESGAGKSMTAAAIIGLIDPPGRISKGEIYHDGQLISKLSGQSLRKVRGKKISIIFQDPLTALDPLMRVGDQIVETIQTHLGLSASKARQRALALLDEVGIADAKVRIDNYPHQFSGGMRQRVVIALALCTEPNLIIADEPTTALDVTIQAQILAVLKRLTTERGTAIMLITHDIGVIAEMADRVAVLYAGRIIEIGRVADVLAQPLHPYTQGLMGAIPSFTANKERLVQILGSMPRLSEVPPGCAFHPRCPQVFGRCLIEKPPLYEPSGRRVACHLYDGTPTQ